MSDRRAMEQRAMRAALRNLRSRPHYTYEPNRYYSYDVQPEHGGGYTIEHIPTDSPEAQKVRDEQNDAEANEEKRRQRRRGT